MGDSICGIERFPCNIAQNGDVLGVVDDTVSNPICNIQRCAWDMGSSVHHVTGRCDDLFDRVEMSIVTSVLTTGLGLATGLLLWSSVGIVRFLILRRNLCFGLFSVLIICSWRGSSRSIGSAIGLTV